MVVKTKRRAEPPVVNELHDGIQFVEPVFERRARQHEREPRTKPLDHAAGLRFPVLDALAFVENDEVPIHPFDREDVTRSEEHTSELQSRSDLVCRLLLEKKKSITSGAILAVTSADCDFREYASSHSLATSC